MKRKFASKKNINLLERNSLFHIILFLSLVLTQAQVSKKKSNSNSRQKQIDVMIQQPAKLLKGGNLINLNFKDRRISSLIKLFQEKAQVNIIASDKVGGSFTAYMTKIPSRDALRSILEVNNLYFIENLDANLIRIVTKSEYQKYAIKNLVTEKVFSITLGKATSIARAIRPMMTKDISKLIIDERNNRIVIFDLPDSLAKIEKVIKAFTAAPGQILIDVHIIENEISDSYEFGVDWSILNVPNFLNRIQTTFIPRDPNDSTRAASSGLSLYKAEGIAGNNGDIEVLIHMIAGDQKITTIANPRIITQQNKRAVIYVGNQIPYNETVVQGLTGNQSSSFKFLETGTKLAITPRITDQGDIQLDLEIEVSSSPRMIQFGPNGSYGKAPEKIATTVQTSVLVKNNTVIILGGLIRKENTYETQGIPLLKDIPILRYLFSYKTSKEVRKDTRIFIKPRIIRNSKTKISKRIKKLILDSETDN